MKRQYSGGMTEEIKSAASPVALIKAVNRAQMCFRTVDVERLVDADHPARLLWEIRTMVGFSMAR